MAGIFWAVWDWLRNFFGNAYLIFVVVGIVLVLWKAIVFRRRAKAERKADAAAAASKQNHKKRVAVITGASSGMGEEFARQLDRTEKELDEIWLIARRQERLEEIGEKLTSPVRVLALDLTDAASYEALTDALDTDGVCVSWLIHCAGYAKIGNYAQISRAESGRMVDLNCRAVVEVTTTVLPYMEAGSRVLLIASSAAFQPIPYMNIYASSKAFVYSYARALRAELFPRKIAVTASCPYWVRDTEFIGIAQETEEAAGDGRIVKNYLFSTTKDKVVRRSLKCSRAGLAVCTPGAFCFFHRLFSKVLSREFLIYFWEGLRRI